MKKRIPTFMAGALSALLLCGIVTTALAVGERLEYNGLDLAIFGERKVSAGESFVTASGTEAPSTITYIDANGAGTNYVSLRLLAQLLGANISWDSDTGTVDFGAAPKGGVEIGVGGTPGYEDLPTSPVLGETAGPFTEIAPREEKGKPRVLLDSADFCSKTGFIGQDYYFLPEVGGYIEIEVTNHGAPVGVYVDRPIWVSVSSVEPFSTVRLDTGKTLTRAFAMGDTDVELDRFLQLTVVALGGMENETDITVTVTQYS